ncbi:MAG: hypothetical protein EOO37_00105 [Cytophagaceae bacterium]|nr:MAG: hypothetical protein EOO37_00105 [Cytophagaceae bacterium]
MLVALVDGTFWTGFFGAVQNSDVPHDSKGLGQLLASALLVLASQLFQWWQNRRAVAAQVQAAVSKHLADCPPELTDNPVQNPLEHGL